MVAGWQRKPRRPFQTYVVHSRAGRDGVSVHLNRMGRTCGHYASALMHHPTTRVVRRHTKALGEVIYSA